MSRLSFLLPAALAVLALPGAARAVPQISQLIPTEGSALRSCCITINGSGFGDAASQRTVLLGSVASSGVIWLGSFGAITSIPQPLVPGSLPVTVSVDGQSSLPAFYSVLGPPAIDSVTPAWAVRTGGPVPLTVRGSYFGVSNSTPRGLTISGAPFASTLDATGGLVANVSTLDHQDIARGIGVTIDGQSTLLDNAFALLDPPVISSISPSAGRASGGTLITLQGDHFGPNSLSIPHSVTTNGSQFTNVTHVDNTRLTGLTPPGTGTAQAVQMSMGATAATGTVTFDFLSPPHISSVTPSSGDLAGGYEITIVGQNFGPDDDAIPRVALVDNRVALPIRWSAPEVLAARVPAGTAAGPVDISISIDGVTYVLPGGFTYSGISGVGAGTPPARLELAQNGPNPFAAAQGTEIRFALPAAGVATLDVFDTRGRFVTDLASGVQPAGMRRVRWDGRDGSGRPVPSGVYLYRLRAAGREIVRRMNLVR